MKYQKKSVAEANNLILIFSNIYTVRRGGGGGQAASKKPQFFL